MAKRSAAPPKHPELAKALQAWKARGGRTGAIAKACGVTFEQARRYVKGEAMPRPAKMKKLAVLIGVPAAELQYGAKIDPRRTPGLATIPMAEVTADEQALLVSYRQLPPFARESLRIRVAELLEEFGKASHVNPFGKGTQ
jgi:transcriptional regulator with XRE-family HTH domain